MPHRFPTSWRYVKWDGTADAALDPDQLMDQLAEDLLRDGDLDLAMRRAMRWGFRQPDGSFSGGMRDVIQRLRQQRQELLDRYDFDSVLGDVAQRLQEIIDQERGTIEQRLAGPQGEAASPDAPGEAESGDGGDADRGGGQSPTEPDRAALERFLASKQRRLDALPPDAPGRIADLQTYDFVDRQASEAFEALVAQLQQQVTDALFNDLMGKGGDGGDGGQQMDPEELREYLQDLNQAFEQHRAGQPVDMDRLNDRWSHMFGGRVDSMEQLAERMRARMAATQALLGLLSPQQRAEVRAMMQQAVQDAGIADQLAELQRNLGPLPQSGMQQRGQGNEELSLGMALQQLEQAAGMEALEAELESASTPADLAGIPPELLEEVLSDEDRAWLDQWARAEQDLIDHGYANRGRRGLELTPRAIRKIGQHALRDIYASLRDLGPGEHDVRRTGAAGDIADTSRAWQFGDAFMLDLPRTVMNGISGRGPGTPVRLRPDDFQVIEREAKTSTATALLIDMSNSMYQSGAWDAAKRVALAMDTLIRSAYPRDTLELIGFSAMAHRLDVTDLPLLEWNRYNQGTNLEHALRLARERLQPERGRNRQIIVITDGEPTAHVLPDGHPFFDYPPHPATTEATLREVVRCTREGIVINTFLLEQSAGLNRFIDDLMRINKGRVLDASPGRLGSYVLRDFLQQRRAQRSA